MEGLTVCIFFAFVKVLQKLVFHPKAENRWRNKTQDQIQNEIQAPDSHIRKKPSEFHIQQPSVKHRESYKSQICTLKLVC